MRWLTVGALLLAAAGACASPVPHSRVPADLQAAYRELDEGFSARDLSRIRHLTSSRLVFRGFDGARDREGALTVFRQMLHGPGVRWTSTLSELRLDGNTAIARVRQVAVQRTADAEDRATWVWRHRWRRTSAGWKLEHIRKL